LEEFPLSMNKLPIEKDSTGHINFSVGGHIYGSSKNFSTFPASTLLANIDSLNNSNLDFFVSLGDLFCNLEEDYDSYKRALFDKIEFPIYNVAGNHDLFNYELYEEKFGPTTFSFVLKRSVLKENVKNVFIFSHIASWIAQYPEIEKLFPGLDKPLLSNFEEEVLPILDRSKNKIYWLSGSMGAYANESFFYKNENNISYILTSIRDKKADGLLNVKVGNNGKVEFKTISLTGEQLQPLIKYNTEYWENLKGNIEFGWPVVKFQLVRALGHNYFWIGGVTFLLLFFLSKFVIRSLIRS